MIRYLSVCSGIEAASVAWHPLGWEPLAFSEIEAFPRAVLAHHYPDVPLHGDFTRLRDQAWIMQADVLVGGTPCQAFSVAGLRNSLADARGNLSLEFIKLADAIDDLRLLAGREPAVVVWENVPGVLSVKDNAFGCFLAGLAGDAAPYVPPRGKWTNAGVVDGPQRTVAWRVLDAQYFGLAQRRRRVFVVASARDGFDPAAVLLEFDGVRRDTPPRRETREVAPTIPSRSTAGGGLGTDFDIDGGVIHLTPEQQAAMHGALRRAVKIVEPSTGDVSHCLNAGGMPALAAAAERVGAAVRAADRVLRGVEGHRHQWRAPARAVLAGIEALGAEGVGDERLGLVILAAQASVAVAVSLRGRDGGATAELGDEVQNCLRASQGGGDKPHVLAPVSAAAFKYTMGSKAHGIGYAEEQSPTLDTKADSNAVLTPAMAVRRLTPVECERLQGFPDGYTMIPWKKKPAADCPDGPRYKALGNSMAVPVMRWIGARIAEALK